MLISQSLHYRIDASEDETVLGRYINNSTSSPNCRMKIVLVDNIPHLCAFVIVDAILPGDELRYNYGPGSYYPWRNCIVSVFQ